MMFTQEWLETNGLGGWAGATVCGINTRRYHALLVDSSKFPASRSILVSRMDEQVRTPAGNFDLSCSQFPDSIAPLGFLNLEQFECDDFPRFSFRAGGARLRKTVFCPHGHHATVIRYEILDAPEGSSLNLRPLIAARDYHALTHSNPGINRMAHFEGGTLELHPYSALARIFIAIDGGAASFTLAPDWFYRYEYLAERMRGFPHQEDLFSYGEISIPIKTGAEIFVSLSAHAPLAKRAAQLFDAEKRRRAALVAAMRVKDPLTTRLARAADQFLVTRSDGRRAIIAGYHWFTDWGRDSMISLPGLCMVTGRLDVAREILATAIAYLRDGLIPNLFHDDGSAEYNTADATLWLFQAAHCYLRYGGERKFIADQLYPALADILAHYRRGTHFSIGEDARGLLHAGDSGTQLTWMDARVEGRAVTPRHGFAVELNALWYNAQRVFGEIAQQLGKKGDAKEAGAAALRTRESFDALFWNSAENCLYDCISDGVPDAAVRPNQILALSLAFPIIEDSRAESILKVVERDLLTPVGLRTLSPRDSRYRGRYEGGPQSRDSSYHQGTAWAWLLGPFLTALVRVRGAAGRHQARAIVSGLMPRLDDAGVGSLSEIFDGDAPHLARGAIAQAWSVAELLRAYCEDIVEG